MLEDIASRAMDRDGSADGSTYTHILPASDQAGTTCYKHVRSVRMLGEAGEREPQKTSTRPTRCARKVGFEPANNAQAKRAAKAAKKMAEAEAKAAKKEKREAKRKKKGTLSSIYTQ